MLAIITMAVLVTMAVLGAGFMAAAALAAIFGLIKYVMETHEDEER